MYRALFVLVAGCGRIAFDGVGSVDGGNDANSDGTVDAMRIHPGDLPPFGTPVKITSLSVAVESDDDPTLTGDMLEIFFDSSRNTGNHEIWTATRPTLADPWSTPTIVTELSSVANDEAPKVSADGLVMYLSNGLGGDYNLYVSKRATRASPWSTPQAVSELNTAERDSGASTDATDTIIVECSETGIVPNLYESRRAQPNGTWSAPALITELQVGAEQETPFVDATGLIVYFDAGGSTHDVYFSERASLSDPWQTPMLLQGVNSGLDESDPWLSPDHLTIYFARQDPTGNKDLFMATRQ